MDEVIIFADSISSHKIKLLKFFARIQSVQVTLQPEKCLFFRREVTYLGHKITKKGVSPDPAKTNAVRDFPRPKNDKNIKQFLGLTGYYRRFVPHFTQIAKLLTIIKEKYAVYLGKQTKRSIFHPKKYFVFLTLITVP